MEYQLVAPMLNAHQQAAFAKVLFGLLCGRPFDELKVVGKDLPKQGGETIAAIFLSKRPLFEPRVKETFAKVRDQDPPGLDKELFPQDLPDALLKKVVRDRQGREAKAAKSPGKGRRSTNAPSSPELQRSPLARRR